LKRSSFQKNIKQLFLALVITKKLSNKSSY